MARKDKQQRKAERREQRKMDRTSTDKGPPMDESFPPEVDSETGLVVSRHITVDS
jgi:hypothetical protein